jgi:hypothetical protein
MDLRKIMCELDAWLRIGDSDRFLWTR